MKRAQALVEFALILPVLLLVILGGAQVYLLILADMRLEHAVIEGVVAGASEASVPSRCSTAIGTAEVIFGQPLPDIRCSEPGNLITLRVREEVPLIVPLFGATFPITVEESAVVREVP